MPKVNELDKGDVFVQDGKKYEVVEPAVKAEGWEGEAVKMEVKLISDPQTAVFMADTEVELAT